MRRPDPTSPGFASPGFALLGLALLGLALLGLALVGLALVACEAATPTGGDGNAAADTTGATSADGSDDALRVPEVDVPDDAGWTPVCERGERAPAYDEACVGNAGCKSLPCDPSGGGEWCSLCDGERCVERTHQDPSSPHSEFSGWPGELAGTLSASTDARLSVDGSPSVALLLEGGDAPPNAAAWLGPDGERRDAPLVAPVTLAGEAVLLAGYRWHDVLCVGTQSESIAPSLTPLADDGRVTLPVAPLRNALQVAWIRVWDDAEGQRVFQWYEPAGPLIVVAVEETTGPALATLPFPTSVAAPLGEEWGGFDWAAALGEAFPPAPAWTPACDRGGHEPAYDSHCAGNVGCTPRVCEPCTTSCVLCDGERCVEAVADDSCLQRGVSVTAWWDDPPRAVAGPAGAAALVCDDQRGDGVEVRLTDPGEPPVSARWLDEQGVERTLALTPPVALVGERILVAGVSTATNHCTGETFTGTEGPLLVSPGEAPPGGGVASLPFAVWDPWVVEMAWIRVFEDAAGVRVYEWFEPAGQETFHGSSGPTSLPAHVTAPFPAEAADPLGAPWDAWDWEAAVTAELAGDPASRDAR